jgi:hypothetical protein
MECRNLVLELDTWNLVHVAFRRFFNKHEMLDITEKFNFNNATAIEKIDGSLIGVFNYNNKWYMTTRGSIEGEGAIPFGDKTFKDLFVQTVGDIDDFYAKLDKKLDYTFELATIENRIVTVYKNPAIYLLGIRNKDFIEQPLSFLQKEYQIIKTDFIKFPKIYEFNKPEDLIQMHKEMDATEEGFVVVDYTKQTNGCYDRLKVKNPAYVALAHMKDSAGASSRCLMQLAILGEEAEFLALFPEFEVLFRPIKEKYDAYVAQVKKEIQEAKKYMGYDKKDYAMKVKSMSNTGLMFGLYDNRYTDYNDYVDKCVEAKGMKLYAKKMLSTLKINNNEIK